MPNWTHNTLTVSGNQKEISEFKKNAKTKKEALSFDKFMAMPRALVGTISPCEKNEKLVKKYGADNWHDWCIENWGVKWDAERSALFTNTKNELVYHFDTAWNPPAKWLESVSKKFPNLKFKLGYFDEFGERFYGVITATNGVMVDDIERNVVAKNYEVIVLENNEPIIVKFLERGHSLTLTRKDNNSGEYHYEDLCKVEHKCETKLLVLPYGFLDITKGIRIKNKTFSLMKKMVEGCECIGLNEIPELNTLENFKKAYDIYLYWDKKQKIMDDPSTIPF